MLLAAVSFFELEGYFVEQRGSGLRLSLPTHWHHLLQQNTWSGSEM